MHSQRFDVQQWVRAIPFEPFQIVTSSGEQYNVRHPDGILVSTRILFVSLYCERRPNVADSVTNISMLHVTELVPLAATLIEPATTN